MIDRHGRRVIMVLGAGRCGTSLLMQILSKFGMSVSEKLVPPKVHNPLGPMEDLDIANIYDKEILPLLCTTRNLPFPYDRFNVNLQDSLSRKLKNIINLNIAKSNSIWGFKDPFSTYLLPLWIQIFNALGVIPFFLLAVRNPSHSAISRKKNFGVSENMGELAWLSNFTDALHHTGADCFVVHYEDWFVRPVDLGQQLLRYTGLDEFFLGNIDDVIIDVVKSNLNRSVYDDYEVKNEYVLNLYQSLKECRGDNFDRVALMAVVKSCRSAMDGFSGWYMEAQSLICQQQQIREQLDKESLREKQLLKQASILRQKADVLIKQVASEKAKVDSQAKQLATACATVEDLVAEVGLVRNSFSWRLGNMLILAFRRPGWRTFRLPYDLICLFKEALSANNQGHD